MNSRTLTIALHGATGRMGANQHFVRSILSIIKQGGVEVSSGERIQVEPILIGRNEQKLQHLAEEISVEKISRNVEWSTNVDSTIARPDVDIVFDASSTQLRASILRKAASCGKAVYCEKPIATNRADAIQLTEDCEAAGVPNGVVQDKLWLPGFRKLRTLLDQDFFGKILSVRGEFGYWVFSGEQKDKPPQRPSWNSRKEDGGGMMNDMFCHWEYLIANLFGRIERVLAHATTHIPVRVDENGNSYSCTADDSAYALFSLENGLICQFYNSFATRVRRDDLLTIQVDGTNGSAVAGLRDCWIQSLDATPRPVWNPDIPQPINFHQGWEKVADIMEYENAFKIQWELFIRHVVGDCDFPWSLRSGIAGVALADAGELSSRESRWVTLEK